MTHTIARKTASALLSAALVASTTLAFTAVPAQAKDVGDLFGREMNIKVGKTYTQKFEKKTDQDAFKFKAKKTGTYMVKVWDLGYTDDADEWEDCIMVHFEKINKRGMYGATHSTYANQGKVSTIKLGKVKKGRYASVMLEAYKKSKYKFRVYVK